jgi:hypothetical protein
VLVGFGKNFDRKTCKNNDVREMVILNRRRISTSFMEKVGPGSERFSRRSQMEVERFCRVSFSRVHPA